MNYPEHEKLEAVKDEAQIIGDFLSATKYTLCELVEGKVETHYLPVVGKVEEAIADYFNIDMQRLEAEKQAMLDEIRQGQK